MNKFTALILAGIIGASTAAYAQTAPTAPKSVVAATKAAAAGVAEGAAAVVTSPSPPPPLGNNIGKSVTVPATTTAAR